MSNFKEMSDVVVERILNEFKAKDVPMEVAFLAFYKLLIFSHVPFHDEQSFDEILNLLKLAFKEVKDDMPSSKIDELMKEINEIKKEFG